MSVKYFFDVMSQPSRAVYIFMKHCKIPFESCPVALRKGEQLTEKYKEINKFQQVPAITHGNFKLAESIAIVRYLSKLYPKEAEALYPGDDKSQAKVDEFLEWHHLALRGRCGRYFQESWLFPMRFGTEPNVEKIAELKDEMETWLDKFQDLWLDNGARYLVDGKLSVADAFAACEIEQPRLSGYDPCNGRPALSEWMNRVRKEFNPSYGEAHHYLNRGSEKASKL